MWHMPSYIPLTSGKGHLNSCVIKRLIPQMGPGKAAHVRACLQTASCGFKHTGCSKTESHSPKPLRGGGREQLAPRNLAGPFSRVTLMSLQRKITKDLHTA